MASSATVQFRTGPNGSPAIPGSVPFTLNFYSDNAGTIGALLGSVTTTVVTPAGTGSVKATQRPFFNVSFDLSNLGFLLPDNLFYGVSIDPFASVTSQSINMSLWNYGTADGFPPTDADYDGMVIKTGTDLSHEYWERGVNGSTDTFAGFTPNLILAAEVPEPNDLALAGIGLLAVALARRRRRGLAA